MTHEKSYLGKSTKFNVSQTTTSACAATNSHWTFSALLDLEIRLRKNNDSKIAPIGFDSFVRASHLVCELFFVPLEKERER